jgi:hypothetical protein
MMGEMDVCGVFISPLLVYALVALVVFAGLRRALARCGFYAVVWHAPLAEFAVLAMVFGVVVRFLPEWVQ